MITIDHITKKDATSYLEIARAQRVRARDVALKNYGDDHIVVTTLKDEIRNIDDAIGSITVKQDETPTELEAAVKRNRQ